MKYIFLAAALSLGGGASHATPVSVDFVIQIVEGSDPFSNDDQAGQLFDGTLSYDDRFVSGLPGGGFRAQADGDQLTFEIDFLRIPVISSFPEIGPNPQAFFNNAGQLTGLDLSLDFPNQFFFGFSGILFTYDFSELVLVDERDPFDPLDDEFAQISLASGYGTIVEPSPVPLPASALLLFAGLAGLGVVRYRDRSRS